MRQCPILKKKKLDQGDSSHQQKLTGDGIVSEAYASMEFRVVDQSACVLDSGASDHMSSHREWFTTYEPLDSPKLIRIGDGALLQAPGKGCINVRMFNGTQWNEKHLVDVLYVPKLKYNLFSKGTALDKGLEMFATSSDCKLTKKGRTVAVGVRLGKLHTMKFEVISANVPDQLIESSEAVAAFTIKE